MDKEEIVVTLKTNLQKMWSVILYNIVINNSYIKGDFEKLYVFSEWSITLVYEIVIDHSLQTYYFIF